MRRCQYHRDNNELAELSALRYKELTNELPGTQLRGEAIGCDQFHLVLMRSSGELPPRPLEKVYRRDVMQIQTWKKLIMLSVLGVLTSVSARAQAASSLP